MINLALNQSVILSIFEWSRRFKQVEKTNAPTRTYVVYEALQCSPCEEWALRQSSSSCGWLRQSRPSNQVCGTLKVYREAVDWRWSHNAAETTLEAKRLSLCQRLQHSGMFVTLKKKIHKQNKMLFVMSWSCQRFPSWEKCCSHAFLYFLKDENQKVPTVSSLIGFGSVCIQWLTALMSTVLLPPPVCLRCTNLVLRASLSDCRMWTPSVRLSDFCSLGQFFCLLTWCEDVKVWRSAPSGSRT